MKNKSIDARMKEYEAASDVVLTRRMPLIIRVDGKCFHTLLRKATKPFDNNVISSMQATALALCNSIPGTKFAYTQSDEISLVVRDDSSLTSEPWMNKRIQKICSLSSAIASVNFTKIYGRDAYFDARAFVIPESEIVNYFIWRQQDCTRNSIQMVGQANFSQKQLHGKSCDAIQEMLFTEKNINYNDFDVYLKRGTGVVRNAVTKVNEHGTFESKVWELDLNIPIFTQNREYIMVNYNKDIEPEG